MFKNMKSLIPKGAKSTVCDFGEKRVFFVRVCTRVYGKLNFEFTIFFILLVIFGSEMRSKGGR